jgi:hypothetical protein
MASRFFHTVFHTLLYRPAVAADHTVLDEIMELVLAMGLYLIEPLTHRLDHSLSVHPKIHSEGMLGYQCEFYDQERAFPIARLLIERGAVVNYKQTQMTPQAKQHSYTQHPRTAKSLWPH